MIEGTFDRIKRIDLLLRKGEAKSPQALADRLKISERSAYGYIRLMKDLGAPIVFKRGIGYHYTEEGIFVIGFQSKCLLPQ